MSRRKQKFPSHFPGEGDIPPCRDPFNKIFPTKVKAKELVTEADPRVCVATTLPIFSEFSSAPQSPTDLSSDQMNTFLSIVYRDSCSKKLNKNNLCSLSQKRNLCEMSSYETEVTSSLLAPALQRLISTSITTQSPELVKVENGENPSVSLGEKNSNLADLPASSPSFSHVSPTLAENSLTSQQSTYVVDASKTNIEQILSDGSNFVKFISAENSPSKSVSSDTLEAQSSSVGQILQREIEKPAMKLIYSSPSMANTIVKASDELGYHWSERIKQSCDLENDNKLSKTDSPSFVCPVCQETFKSKRSFNLHILVHCQLVKNSVANRKLAVDSDSETQAGKSLSFITNLENQMDESLSKEDSAFPLDLSCKKVEDLTGNFDLNLSCQSSSLLSMTVSHPSVTLSDPLQAQLSDQNLSVLADRSPLEDENENLVNEAREHEKAFFDTAQNEPFLSEDSSALDPPPPLPLFSSGGVTRRVKVCSDDGPPMVYKVKFHAEQIFVSRILGINEETGDKIELYKCFICSFSFPSVSRFQAHLSRHKQRFVCRKCNFSCDSRIQFSQHVQKEHVTKGDSREHGRSLNENCEDSSNAENTVTVAALLSALHGKSIVKNNLAVKEEKNGRGGGNRSNQDDDEEHKSEEESSFPASPSSELHMDVGEVPDAGVGGGADIFKMFSCRFCGKKFDRAFSCNRHERVHTGYKPCFCRICGRGFSEPRNLRHHVIRFHSDGSLRHLIKRDRRKRKEDELLSSSSESPSKEVLKDCGNQEHSKASFFDNSFMGSRQELAPTSCSNGFLVTTEESVRDCQNGTNNFDLHEQLSGKRNDAMNNYTTNLTKLFAASLDNSKYMKPDVVLPSNPSQESKHLVGSQNKTHLQFPEITDAIEQLEPGEIRLNLKTKIVDEGERGKRLVIADDHSEDGFDHSPQFSSYAPRLNIVQEPVKREKVLIPITDDIGRTFYECPYCLKFFGSTSDLNRHLDFHEDLRPYDCKYCEYSARTNSQLKVHKMRHEGIKQFSCDVCNYNGVTQSDLNRHKKTQSHIARSQNVCSMCCLGFYSSSQKQVHITKCHPEMEGASSLIQMSLGFPSASPPPTSAFIPSSSALSLACETESSASSERGEESMVIETAPFVSQDTFASGSNDVLGAQLTSSCHSDALCSSSSSEEGNSGNLSN